MSENNENRTNLIEHLADWLITSVLFEQHHYWMSPASLQFLSQMKPQSLFLADCGRRAHRWAFLSRYADKQLFSEQRCTSHKVGSTCKISGLPLFIFTSLPSCLNTQGKHQLHNTVTGATLHRLLSTFPLPKWKRPFSMSLWPRNFYICWFLWFGTLSPPRVHMASAQNCLSSLLNFIYSSYHQKHKQMLNNNRTDRTNDRTR